ncbi:MAG: hypothetical protein LCH96_06910 [Actinobacteria bacterium]|nr:hypothetical protein [Actinomycetota bacterium]
MSRRTPRPEPATALERDLRTAKVIARWVSAVYYVAAIIIFRDVLASIPAVLSGHEVIVGDELVPFFDWNTQLLDQAAGHFNDLTNGYEFRVRYAFLTTWLRHYAILPFAIVLVIPTLFMTVYRVTSSFIIDIFRTLSPVTVALTTSFPTSMIYLIVIYAKVTHFYTLGLGLVMVTISILYLLRAVLFTPVHWVRQIVLACVVTLFNPAVHYLVLFSVFFAVGGVVLAMGELARWIRLGGPAALVRLPGRVRGLLASGQVVARVRGVLHRWGGTTLGRGVAGGLIFVVTTLIPYALFVKYVALRGVENLSETVPGDYYFIRDASVSWLHVLSWDLAGIMDKVYYGDYLAKVPRYPNLAYTLLYFAPLLIPVIRRGLANTRAHRQLLGVIYVVSVFCIWATIGYAEPQWFPSFHRALAAVTRTVYATGTPIGSLTLDLSSSIVQVLRFPHRFQLLLFAFAPLVMTLPIAWGIDALHRLWLGRRDAVTADAARTDAAGRVRDSHLLRAAAVVILCLSFFSPFWSNANYRQTITSGNWGTFLAPYPVDDLAALKAEIRTLPDGKVAVMPPTETAKVVADDNGVDHKFIDKFFIYYLNDSSFYYGLTGDSYNKFEFFLILRGLYYQQDWWINPARDIGLRYIVVNKKLHTNGGVGAEYLPDVESYIGPALERQVSLGQATKRYENGTYALYEIADAGAANRKVLIVDSSWKDYLRLVWNRLDLTRCYKFEYLPFYEPGENAAANPQVYSDDPTSSGIDLWVASHKDAFFTPTPKTFPFDPNVVASSYYLSPMFREYLLFSNTKWNRTGMITPGVFGTLNGSFVAVPRATSFTIPVTVPDAGRYHVLLRGSFSANQVTITSKGLGLSTSSELRSSADHLQYFTKDTVYTPDRTAVDTSQLSVADLEARISSGDLVPVNLSNEYQDLGVVQADRKGGQNVVVTKTDGNPMLVEGIVLVPEEEYQQAVTQTAVEVVDPSAKLSCDQTYPVFGPESEGYVDPAENDAHKDLSNEELLTLAAAAVTSLEPDDSGGLGADGLILVLAGALLLSAVLTVVSRTRTRRPDDPQPDPSPASTATERTPDDD